MAIRHLSHIGPSDSATTVSVAGTAPCCRSRRSRRGSHSAASLPIIKHRQVLQSRMSCLRPRVDDCRAPRVTTVNGGCSGDQLVAGLGLAVETRAAFRTCPIAQGRNIGSIRRSDLQVFPGKWRLRRIVLRPYLASARQAKVQFADTAVGLHGRVTCGARQVAVPAEKTTQAFDNPTTHDSCRFVDLTRLA
jgi:hypothetical protein